MATKPVRPSVKQVKITDSFWSAYLDKIRRVSLPYIFNKFESEDITNTFWTDRVDELRSGGASAKPDAARQQSYFDCFRMVIDGISGRHNPPSFSDGLVLESIRGACDFLAAEYDADLDARLDGYIDLIRAAQAVSGDGYLCTYTTTLCPEWRWGQNGGDIVVQHDLYNHGALVEAAVSHYLATGKTSLLECAVKAAKLICSYIGYPPKNNIIPGHSLPEEAFIKLYRLFRDHRELDSFAQANGVNFRDYLDIAIFWYDNRGNYEGRTLAHDPKFAPKYNQDHLPFAQQTSAEGHSVRAALCYTGASMAAYETDREDYRTALNAIWQNITRRKLHISGGIGTRHDIEGFDVDYNLPHDAYLETCAAIAFAFFCGERALLERDAECFDFFERSLYNNILASIAEDGTHYFYENPLVSDGSLHRWDWHICPCCPPMLLKLYSSLATYVYAYADEDLYVNLLMDSTLDTDLFRAALCDRKLRVDSLGREAALHIRVPEYAKDFALFLNGKPVKFAEEKGYAVLRGVWTGEETIEILFDTKPALVVCNPLVEANRGQVAVVCGPIVYCAEGFDNQGDVRFTIAADPGLTKTGETITGKTADGKTFTLIPYFRWCNHETPSATDHVMRVWFPYEAMPGADQLAALTANTLYSEL